MKRRDFLKGLSALVPASLLARFDTQEVVEEVVAQPENVFVTWDEPSPAKQDFMVNSSYFASGGYYQNGGVVRRYKDEDWH